MSDFTAPSRRDPEGHQRGASKLSRIPVKVNPSAERIKKPSWIRAKVSVSPRVDQIKKLLREHNLHSVCEEASCPNLGECFASGTATFMIMGDICTRRCPFCDVAHGRPLPLDPEEPQALARAVELLKLDYVVVTSVDRDDLRDGGAAHFSACIGEIRDRMPRTRIEVLVPDFRARLERALSALRVPPDVFNHNLETVPRLYRAVRPGSDYAWSLQLLQAYKQQQPQVKTKSGLMLGIGEEIEEVEAVMQDLRDHDVDMLTLGQYLQPSLNHLPVTRFVLPEEFDHLAQVGAKMGFSHVASGPMVRSSYHADLQAQHVIESID